MNTMGSHSPNPFNSFFTHRGFSGVGEAILKYLSARDQVVFMESWCKVEEFILNNAGLRWAFIKKAQVECPPGPRNFRDPLNFIFDDLEREKNERKMKLAVFRFKLHFQCWYQMFLDEEPSSFIDYTYMTQDIQSKFLYELQRLLQLCTDEELLMMAHFNIKSSSILKRTILTTIKCKNVIDRRTGTTALHLLAESGQREELETWLKMLPHDGCHCPVDFLGQTPLHKAVNRYDKIEHVKILCQHMSRKDIEKEDNAGKTALDWAKMQLEEYAYAHDKKKANLQRDIINYMLELKKIRELKHSLKKMTVAPNKNN